MIADILVRDRIFFCAEYDVPCVFNHRLRGCGGTHEMMIFNQYSGLHARVNLPLQAFLNSLQELESVAEKKTTLFLVEVDCAYSRKGAGCFCRAFP